MSKRLLFVLVLVALILVIAWLKRTRLSEAARAWFTEAVSPFNLAIFRIVVFSLILVTGDVDRSDFFASLPDSLRYPPELMSWVPLEGLTRGFPIILAVFRITTIMAIVGCCTRLSAPLSTATAIVVLGLPNWYGKVNHAHHLVWLAALLAFAPCAITLSVDGIKLAFLRADQGDVAKPESSPAYGVPLRFLILFLGVAYLFPAFYKLCTVGPAWVSATNLRGIMHLDWNRMGHWLPSVRLDGNSVLLVLGGLFTLGFELAFLPLALLRRSRLLAGFAGIVFHNMTYLNLGIRFGTVQWLYVGFVDWGALLPRLGRKLKPLTVLYDGECRFCRRSIAAIRSLDLIDSFEAIDFRQLHSSQTLPVMPSLSDLDRELHAWTGDSWVKGVAAFERIIRRVPFLWMVWPFLVLPGSSHLARAAYRWIADHRHRLIGERPSITPSLGSIRPVLALGVAILGVNLVFAAKRWTDSWPFACYPPYDHAGVESVTFLAYADGLQVFDPMRDQTLRETFLANRLNGLAQHIKNDPDRRHQLEAAKALLAIWRQLSSAAPSDQAVPVIASEWTAPEKWDLPGLDPPRRLTEAMR